MNTNTIIDEISKNLDHYDLIDFHWKKKFFRQIPLSDDSIKKIDDIINSSQNATTVLNNLETYYYKKLQSCYQRNPTQSLGYFINMLSINYKGTGLSPYYTFDTTWLI